MEIEAEITLKEKRTEKNRKKRKERQETKKLKENNKEKKEQKEKKEKRGEENTTNIYTIFILQKKREEDRINKVITSTENLENPSTLSMLEIRLNKRFYQTHPGTTIMPDKVTIFFFNKNNFAVLFENQIQPPALSRGAADISGCTALTGRAPISAHTHTHTHTHTRQKQY